jgi:hypothetical protein
LSANQTISVFLVCGLGSGAHSAKLLAGTKHRFSALSYRRQCGEVVVRIFVTGGHGVLGGGGTPHRIMDSSRPTRCWVRCAGYSRTANGIVAGGNPSEAITRTSIGRGSIYPGRPLTGLTLTGELHRNHLNHHYCLRSGRNCEIIVPGDNEPSGFILTTILGIVGAFVATFLGQSLGWYRPGEAFSVQL